MPSKFTASAHSMALRPFCTDACILVSSSIIRTVIPTHVCDACEEKDPANDTRKTIQYCLISSWVHLQVLHFPGDFNSEFSLQTMRKHCKSEGHAVSHPHTSSLGELNAQYWNASCKRWNVGETGANSEQLEKIAALKRWMPVSCLLLPRYVSTVPLTFVSLFGIIFSRWFVIRKMQIISYNTIQETESVSQTDLSISPNGLPAPGMLNTRVGGTPQTQRKNERDRYMDTWMDRQDRYVDR